MMKRFRWRPSNIRDGKSRVIQVLMSQTVVSFLVSFFLLLMLQGFLSQSEVKDLAWSLEWGSWTAWSVVIWSSIFAVIVTSVLTSSALSIGGRIDRESLIKNLKAVLFSSLFTILFIVLISFWWMVLYRPEVMSALNGLDKIANWYRYVVYFNLVGTGGNPFFFWICILVFYQGIYVMIKYLTKSSAIW